MDTFAQVIKELGGSAIVGARLRQPAGTVRQWRNRDSIPAEYWPGVVSLAKDQGKSAVTFELLAGLAASKTRRSATPAQQDAA